MSNLYKKNCVVSRDERVIDYNEVIKSKLNFMMEAAKKNKMEPGGFINGLNAEIVESLLDTGSENQEGEDTRRMIGTAEIEAAAAQAEETVNKANEEAEKIIREAQEKADRIKENAYTEGKAEGLSEAQNEIAGQKAACKRDYDAKELELKQQYQSMRDQMEPELTGTILEVFRKVFQTISEDQEDILIALINSVMKNAELGREFIIKVSPGDYKFLVNNQGKIYCAMAKDIQLEIIEDSSMKKNQCIIECDTGVYDCSLDIQLENLIKDIKMLSCMSS